MDTHRIVSKDEWVQQRKTLLEKENGNKAARSVPYELIISTQPVST